MHLSEGTRAFLAAIPDGPEGIAVTLHLMARITRAYRKHPGIVALAREIVSHLPEKDVAGEVGALHAFVRDEIRYVNDVRDVETLSTPDRTLAIGSGDCDDKATLLATLLEAIGYPTRFYAAAFAGGDLSHVWPEVKLGESWFALEVTEPVAPGWRPPGITNKMIVTV